MREKGAVTTRKSNVKIDFGCAEKCRDKFAKASNDAFRKQSKKALLFGVFGPKAGSAYIAAQHSLYEHTPRLFAASPIENACGRVERITTRNFVALQWNNTLTFRVMRL